jgi:RNA polymerase sigma factor (sigma-70 family)
MPRPDYAALPDPELIAACLDHNDHQAWETLVRRYQRLIYTIPFQVGLSEPEAAEIFQTVCVLLFENLAYLRQRDRLGGWLAVTTRRAAWRMIRQVRKTASVTLSVELLEEHTGDDLSLEESLVQLERQALVRAALERLGEGCRQLLELLFYTEPRPSYNEIIQTLGLPAGSIGPTRARCLEKLVKVLTGMGLF